MDESAVREMLDSLRSELMREVDDLQRKIEALEYKYERHAHYIPEHDSSWTDRPHDS